MEKEKKEKTAKKNVGVRISEQQYDFLKEIALEYNCESDRVQDTIRAIITEQMKNKGYLKNNKRDEEPVSNFV